MKTETMTAHTCEPVVYGMTEGGWPCAIGIDGKRAFLADGTCSRYQHREEKIRRAIECWNACASLPDPAVVPELRQHLSAARASLYSVVGNIEHEIAQGAMPFGGSTRALLAMLRQDIARINATLGNEGYRCGKAAP